MVTTVELDPDDWDGGDSREVEALRAAIVDNHRKEHEGAIQWCDHVLCQTYEEHR